MIRKWNDNVSGSCHYKLEMKHFSWIGQCEEIEAWDMLSAMLLELIISSRVSVLETTHSILHLTCAKLQYKGAYFGTWNLILFWSQVQVTW